MKKLSLLLIIIMILSVVGCNQTNDNINSEKPSEDVQPVEESKDPVNITIAGLKGPTSIGMIKMIDEKALNSSEYNVEYIAESAPDALNGKIINGDIQISSLPINAASVLYNKTNGGIQIMALNTIGNLYIVGSDEISSINDLEEKTLGMSAKGSTPDFAMNYILKQNSLKDKVELDYSLDHPTLAQTVIAEDTKVALLPQPFATQAVMKNDNVKILLDLNEEWKNATNGESELFTGCIVVNTEFAKNNKEFVNDFLKQYESSVNWVIENPVDASVLVEKHEIMPNAALVEKAIPYCGITYQPAIGVKENINNFYKILFDSNPASVGGNLPDEEFYYSE
ncbi:ABC transporter substrate-binding protein [Sedimentibacter sp. MB31-C6]|uniref:ABC transporter substrate-binding protein n=1 Tax=Sedimentibacter sp. MB31-C6 TaxID=3109366 RepID=UPI002DDCE0BE|nr:ABC transporter substrate-binding protein [Sedimentibacter sp. MB36-C1]WSI05171.1 ABC transporter substrate-binding protein [Sedimentibacter sp. MB36-C1]